MSTNTLRFQLALDAFNKIDELKDFNYLSLCYDLSKLSTVELDSFERLMRRIIDVVDELKIKVDMNPHNALATVIDKARLTQFKKGDK